MQPAAHEWPEVTRLVRALPDSGRDALLAGHPRKSVDAYVVETSLVVGVLLA